MNKKLESYTAKGAMQGVTSKKLDEEIQLKIQLEKERNQLQFDIEELKKKSMSKIMLKKKKVIKQKKRKSNYKMTFKRCQINLSKLKSKLQKLIMN